MSIFVNFGEEIVENCNYSYLCGSFYMPKDIIWIKVAFGLLIKPENDLSLADKMKLMPAKQQNKFGDELCDLKKCNI